MRCSDRLGTADNVTTHAPDTTRHARLCGVTHSYHIEAYLVR